MGKIPDLPKQKKRPAPPTKEAAAVKAAGDRVAADAANKQGRSSTHLTNPAMKTGFSGLFAKKTGSV